MSSRTKRLSPAYSMVLSIDEGSKEHNMYHPLMLFIIFDFSLALACSINSQFGTCPAALIIMVLLEGRGCEETMRARRAESYWDWDWNWDGEWWRSLAKDGKVEMGTQMRSKVLGDKVSLLAHFHKLEQEMDGGMVAVVVGACPSSQRCWPHLPWHMMIVQLRAFLPSSMSIEFTSNPMSFLKPAE